MPRSSYQFSSVHIASTLPGPPHIFSLRSVAGTSPSAFATKQVVVCKAKQKYLKPLMDFACYQGATKAASASRAPVLSTKSTAVLPAWSGAHGSQLSSSNRRRIFWFWSWLAFSAAMCKAVRPSTPMAKRFASEKQGALDFTTQTTLTTYRVLSPKWIYRLDAFDVSKHIPTPRAFCNFGVTFRACICRSTDTTWMYLGNPSFSSTTLPSCESRRAECLVCTVPRKVIDTLVKLVDLVPWLEANRNSNKVGSEPKKQIGYRTSKLSSSCTARAQAINRPSTSRPSRFVN